MQRGLAKGIMPALFRAREGERSPFVIGAIAGLSGGLAYLVEMQVDLKLLRPRTDDMVLLGGVFVRDEKRARRLGVLIHTANSAAIGTIYVLAVRTPFPGPGWVKGTVFANVENAALYPLLKLEHLHPAIRDGKLDTYWTATAFLQGVLRHVAFGAVMGWVAERLRRI